MAIEQGARVILVVPEIPRLHRQPATVAQPTVWGAHVICPAAASGRFRAVLSEMREQTPVPVIVMNGTSAARDLGYTGDECAKCGGMKMRYKGKCLSCDDCGESAGGCS